MSEGRGTATFAPQVNTPLVQFFDLDGKQDAERDNMQNRVAEPSSEAMDTDDEDAPSIELAPNGLAPDEAVSAADEAPTDEPADGVGTIDPKLKSKLEAKGQMKEQSNTKDLSKVKIVV